MELILMVNLAFSIVGFFFIFRMWREVKSRRDEFGENFNIPRAKRPRNAKRSPKLQRYEDVEEYLDMYEEEPEHGFTQDDVRRLQQLIALSQAEEVSANEVG